MTTTATQTNYAPVNGIELYYQIHGEGDPLVLLHGGVGAIEMFGENLATLAAGRQVIGVDLQAHGRTADIDRPISLEAMADDVAALIKFPTASRSAGLGTGQFDYGIESEFFWSLGKTASITDVNS